MLYFIKQGETMNDAIQIKTEIRTIGNSFGILIPRVTMKYEGVNLQPGDIVIVQIVKTGKNIKAQEIKISKESEHSQTAPLCSGRLPGLILEPGFIAFISRR